MGKNKLDRGDPQSVTENTKRGHVLWRSASIARKALCTWSLSISAWVWSSHTYVSSGLASYREIC